MGSWTQLEHFPTTFGVVTIRDAQHCNETVLVDGETRLPLGSMGAQSIVTVWRLTALGYLSVTSTIYNLVDKKCVSQAVFFRKTPEPGAYGSDPVVEIQNQLVLRPGTLQRRPKIE